MTTAATVFVEAAIGMAAGGGLYSVAAYATGLVLFGLICVGWVAQRYNLKCRMMVFRITTSHADSIATEIQRLMASLKIPLKHFRVAMAGGNSVVESHPHLTNLPHQTTHTLLN